MESLLMAAALSFVSHDFSVNQNTQTPVSIKAPVTSGLDTSAALSGSQAGIRRYDNWLRGGNYRYRSRGVGIFGRLRGRR